MTLILLINDEICLPACTERRPESLIWCDGWALQPQLEETTENVAMTVRHIKYGMGVSEDSTTGIGSTCSGELTNIREQSLSCDVAINRHHYH